MNLTTAHPIIKTVSRTPRRYSSSFDFRPSAVDVEAQELNWIVAHLGKDEITALVERFGRPHFQRMWEKAMKRMKEEAV